MTTARNLKELHESDLFILTRAEVARIMRIDVRTLAHAIDAGDVPCIHLGKRVMIPREPLLRLLTDETKFGAA